MDHLSSEKSWLKFIQQLDFSPAITSKQAAKQALETAIITALKAQIKPHTAILFSGGVDSTLVAFLSKKLGYNLSCYALGFPGSADLFYARKIAQEYSLNLKEIVISQDDLASTIPKVISILKTADFVKVSVGCLMYIACQHAAKDNIKLILTGAGTEDTLTGYHKHLIAFNTSQQALQKELKHGLLTLYERDITRDFSIASHFNISLDSPFLSKDFIKTAVSIDNKLKINQQNNKLILRGLALDLGLTKEFSFRKKKAAQYGSRIEQGLGKLAKKHGFRYKAGYLRSFKDRLK